MPLAYHSPGPQSKIEFLNKPFTGGCKVHFYGVVRGFRLILAFFEQKVPKIWRRNGSVKKKLNVIFGLTILKYPYGYQFLSIICDYIICDLKTLSWSSWGIYFIDVTPFIDI
mgnify:CR=1 FL=1